MGTLRTARRRLDPRALRAAFWAARALRSARRQLQWGRLDDVTLPTPPVPGTHAWRGVDAVLRRTAPTCLERSLVLQRWLAACDEPRDVVIGVTGPADGFSAHAWIEGERHGGYEELTRLRP